MSVTSGAVCFVVRNEIKRTFLSLSLSLSLSLCFIIVKETLQRTCVEHYQLSNEYLIHTMLRFFEFTLFSSEDCLPPLCSLSLSRVWGITEPKFCRGSYRAGSVATSRCHPLVLPYGHNLFVFLPTILCLWPKINLLTFTSPRPRSTVLEKKWENSLVNCFRES